MTPDADQQRRVVAQGVLWTAGVEVPTDGVPVAFDSTYAGSWLDTR